MRIDIIAAGRLKKGPLYDLSQDYLGRMRWTVTLFEIESRIKDPVAMAADERARIASKINPDHVLIALDERGKSLRSVDFAKKLDGFQGSGRPHVQFIIGGADGLGDELRQSADFILGLGVQTWPHMLARIMLLEQIYRAQQILSGHPYHRE